jgi:hypothetical protein
VDLEELDRIIDPSTHAPLSESERQKLKTALHAMAERLLWKRTMEKTSAVLPRDSSPVEKPNADESAPAGYRRHGAVVFTGANRGLGSTSHSPIRQELPGMRPRESLPPEGDSGADPIRGAAAAGNDSVRDGGPRCNACGQVLRRSPNGQARKNMM